jgi:hypothetical protein
MQGSRRLLPAIALGALLAGPAGPAPAQDPPGTARRADVTKVAVLGSAGSYLFQVTVESPDTGCDRYADWWEVVTPEGELVYRRVLAHSHPREQPFTRTGGPIFIDADREVIVRAHLNPGGYGGAAMRGTPSGGFRAASVAADFAAGVAQQPPLPKGCAF